MPFSSFLRVSWATWIGTTSSLLEDLFLLASDLLKQSMA